MAKKEMIVGSHLVRYGIAPDQKYLVGEFLETYDQLVINASMVAHMAGGLALFMAQQATNKPYFIEPQTHAFQHDIEYLQSDSEKSKGKIKRSIRSLLEAYGEPVKRIVLDEENSILPEDFDDEKLRCAFCQRVIEYQLNALVEKAKKSENAKYYEFLKEKGIIDSVSFVPSFVVAPYFCMGGNTFDEWLGVNIACAKNSMEIAAKLKKPLAVQIVISQNVLFDTTQSSSLIKSYAKLKPDAFLIWVDSFSEQEVSAGLLSSFVDMIKKLGQPETPVINLYGGYFSVLLLHLGILNGVTHSLEYGEKRPVVPVGGGIPSAKFYLPALHMRLRREDAIRAVRALGGMEGIEKFHSNVCNCSQCKKIISNDPTYDFANYLRTKRVNRRDIPLPETKDNSVRHYMWRKEKEYEPGANVSEILEELRENGKQLRRALGVENTEHCNKWADILSGL